MLPEKSGLYLLVAPNGSGKSTLLTVLDRIGNRLAFSQMFKSSSANTHIDQYINSEIVYEVGGGLPTVKFSKGKQKWVSKPKSNENVLKSYGYTGSYFVKADPNRIAVRQDELEKIKPKDADRFIIDGMNALFSTKKYNELIQYKIGDGRGKGKNHVYAIKNKYGTYSEKRFSTGELAILRLLKDIMEIKEGSLLLLDEAELALHPKVQLKLLEYLKELCEQKKITAIIATHSQAMIQNTRPDHIIMLNEQDEEKFTVVNPCYPAQALGEVYGKDLTPPDAIYYVEDEMAYYILDEVFRYAKKLNFKTDRIDRIKRQIYPVGSYEATARLALREKNGWSNYTKVKAVVDHDVYDFDKEVKDAKRRQNHAVFMNKHESVLVDLGCTPEVALIEQLEKNDPNLVKSIDSEYCCDIREFVSSKSYSEGNGNTPRKIAKNKFDKIVNYLLNKDYRPGKHVIIQHLVQLCVPMIYSEKATKELVGKLLP